LDIFADEAKVTKLRIELAVVVDTMKCFVQATYDLEGDGFLIVELYDRLQLLTMFTENPQLPNTEATIRDHSVHSEASGAQKISWWTSLLEYAETCYKLLSTANKR